MFRDLARRMNELSTPAQSFNVSDHAATFHQSARAFWIDSCRANVPSSHVLTVPPAQWSKLTEDGCEALRNQFFTDKVLEPARTLSSLRNAILRQSPIGEDQVASALFVNNILLRESAPRAQKHQIGTTNIGSIIRENYAKNFYAIAPVSYRFSWFCANAKSGGSFE